jgi:serine/threonine-protein kinase
VTLLEPVGRGTLGEVRRGVLESSWGVRSPVAVKLFDATDADDQAELFQRLANLARQAAWVRHPSVVQTLDVDCLEGPASSQAFVVMELVSGEALSTLLPSWADAGRRVPVDFALAVALRIAEGLGEALLCTTAEGSLTALVHGDLSPKQVLVSEHGDVKVGDFGQGTLRDVVSNVRSRYAMGYAAPEVACGLDADPRADVFSLGVLLHEMLIGPRFAPHTSTSEVMAMVRDGRFHTDVMGPNLPRDLRALIDCAIAPNAAYRFPHARALAFDLRREMLKVGLCDAQTCIRQAVVGQLDVEVEVGVRDPRATEAPPPRKSDVAPRASSEEATSPELRRVTRR